MAPISREELAKQLEGKKPEEIIELLHQKETELDATKAATEANTQRLNDLAKQVGDYVAKPSPAPASTTTPTEKPDWYRQPEKAAEELIDRKMGPYINTFLSNVEVQAIQAVESQPYYGLLKADVDKLIAQMPPETKAVPGATKAVYDMVVGQNLAKVQEFEKKKAERTAEFTETTSTAGARREEAPKATPLQEQIAAGLGIPVEKYLQWEQKPDEMTDEVMAAVAATRSK